MRKYLLTMILSIISISFLVYIFLKILACPSFSEYTGLYFFSTLIQANAAIFSIVGVFYIFRLQSIQSAIANIFNALYNEDPNIRRMAQEFNIKIIEDKKSYVESISGNDYISNYYKNWLNYELDLNDIKIKIKQPLVTIMVLIIFQILFLLITNGLHTLGFLYEMIAFIIVTLFQIYVLINVVSSIISITNKKNV